MVNAVPSDHHHRQHYPANNSDTIIQEEASASFCI